ncbi:hypothetical protein TNCV_860331 [Trichonephila clavipes]|nr:hypothetical protein TNCV_860331 [Trichonephila clavipes]
MIINNVPDHNAVDSSSMSLNKIVQEKTLASAASEKNVPIVFCPDCSRYYLRRRLILPIGTLLAVLVSPLQPGKSVIQRQVNNAQKKFSM